MSDSIETTLRLNPDQKVIQVLQTDGFKVIGLGFMKGQILEKHKTSTAAFLFVYSGEVEFLINGENLNLKSGSFFRIPENVEHEVRALEDSRLLLVK